MVNTMPTKPAVSSATPSDLGPTSFSCSSVLRQWILPAQVSVNEGVADSRSEQVPVLMLQLVAEAQRNAQTQNPTVDHSPSGTFPRWHTLNLHACPGPERVGNRAKD